MNARLTRLFPRTFAAARSRAAARSAAGRAPRRCARKRPAACRDTASGTAIRVPGRRKAEPGADLERAVAALESEAVRRALSGVAVPVFHQGRECGSTVKHSDQLLMFLLKTLKPSRYACGKDSAPAAPAAPEKIFALEVDLSAAGDAPASEEPGGGEGEVEDGDEDAGQREAEEAAKGDGRDASTQGAAKGAARVRQDGRLAQARGRAGRLTCPAPERPSESAGGRSPKARPLAGQVRAGVVPGRPACAMRRAPRAVSAVRAGPTWAVRPRLAAAWRSRRPGSVLVCSEQAAPGSPGTGCRPRVRRSGPCG